MLSASVLYMNNWKRALKTREGSDLVSSNLGQYRTQMALFVSCGIHFHS